MINKANPVQYYYYLNFLFQERNNEINEGGAYLWLRHQKAQTNMNLKGLNQVTEKKKFLAEASRSIPIFKQTNSYKETKSINNLGHNPQIMEHNQHYFKNHIFHTEPEANRTGDEKEGN